jgi:hypothetical protein
VSLGEPSSFNGLFIVSLFFAWLVVLGVGLGVIWFVAYRYDRITTRRAIDEITGTPRRSGKENNQFSWCTRFTGRRDAVCGFEGVDEDEALAYLEMAYGQRSRPSTSSSRHLPQHTFRQQAATCSAVALWRKCDTLPLN